MHANPDAVLDVRHEDSPVPTIKTKEFLDELSTGDVLKVITSKESTIKNIRMLVANNPFVLLHESKTEEGFIFLIEKQ